MIDESPNPTPESAPHGPKQTRPSRVPVWISGAVVIALAIATAIAFSSGNPKTQTANERTDDTTNSAATNIQETADVGEAVPNITFEWIDGSQAEFSAILGQPLVVNFFASYCTPCVTEMPDFESVHSEMGDKVRFIGINVSEPAEAGQRIVDQTGVTYDIGRDPTGKIMRELGGIAMPTTVFITADGKIAEIHSGQLTRDRLEAIVTQKLLA